ncbi:MAG TPA: hypothetical protein VEL76_16505 [Gemmataceae bacterium]|nr:hypothetical protein [Gemmataceae bacterium]
MTRKVYPRRFIDPAQQYRRWIDPRYRSLRLADVTAYLQERGWQELPSDREHFLVFAEPSGGMVDGVPLCQFVPASEAYGDYAGRLFELLTGVAEVEERPAAEVIDDILRLASRRDPNGAVLAQPRPTEASSK